MKIIDLFSGVGGLSLGFELAGFETVASVDIWGDAIKTYNHNRKNKNGIVMDIDSFNNTVVDRIIKTHRISGVIGGPPCQGFSTARLSDMGPDLSVINDKRNHLYLEFYKTVRMIKPDFFVIENVRGMVKANNGLFFKDILERFGSLGYNVEYQIINAADYGVPQNRFRVFFIGLRNGKFKFPKKQTYKLSVEDALSDLPSKIIGKKLKYNSDPKNHFQELMRKNSKVIYNHEITNHSLNTIEIISKIPDGGSIKSLPPDFWHIRKYNKAFQRMNSKMPSHTIDTGHRNYFHFRENRIPTVREAARIQSFPDNFEFLGSRTSQYKQVGNAVPPLMAKAIANSIIEHLK